MDESERRDRGVMNYGVHITMLPGFCYSGKAAMTFTRLIQTIRFITKLETHRT